MNGHPLLNAQVEKRYSLLDHNAVENLPPTTWLIKGILPATGLAAIYGAPGTGKSFLAMDLACAIAAGREWFGHRVRPAPVIYCVLEGEGGIKARLRACKSKHGAEELGQLRFLIEPFNLREEDDRSGLVQTIREARLPAPLIILDTLNQASPGMDENSSADMGDIISVAKAIQSDLGGLVLLVHHTGKDTTRGLRGHSSLNAALDAAIEVSRSGDSRSWTLAKSKDGKDGEEKPFTLETVEVGTDEDGELITSCVVSTEGAQLPSKRPARLSKNTKAALECLVSAIHQHGIPAPTQLAGEIPDPPERVVTDDQWRREFCARAKPDGKPDTRRKAFTRARKELSNIGAIAEWSDYVWPVRSPDVLSIIEKAERSYLPPMAGEIP